MLLQPIVVQTVQPLLATTEYKEVKFLVLFYVLLELVWNTPMYCSYQFRFHGFNSFLCPSVNNASVNYGILFIIDFLSWNT